MKAFDTNSILLRQVANLQNNSNWAQVVSDGTVQSLLSAHAESESEVVRYLEYMFTEGRWGNARNTSSLVSGASYMSYKPARKVSAQSTQMLIVSANSALTQAGISNIFGTSDLTLANLPTPYSPSTNQPTLFSINVGDIFATSDGTQFFATKKVDYVLSDDSKNSLGTLYVQVPIMQGIRTSATINTLGNPFEQIILPYNDIESANNPVSKQFFSVSGVAFGTATSINYTIYDSIYEAGPTEYACQVDTSPDFSSVTITFGNGVAGAVVPSGTITVNYVQTLGSAGNISANYVINTVVTAGVTSVPLYCSNIPTVGTSVASILGGSDGDSIEVIRANAPVSYLTSGSIITDAEYAQAVKSPNIPYILESTVFSGFVTNPTTGAVQNVIQYSAIQNNGTAPDSVSYPQAVNTAILGKNSPLDSPVYTPPGFLHIKYNYSGVIVEASSALASSASTIQGDLYGKLVITNQKFNNPFIRSVWDTYVASNYNVRKQNVSFVEAVADILPSSFVADQSVPNYYTASFTFDPSFERLRNFNDGSPICLKIDIVFNCAECNYNGNSFSRTLLLTQYASPYPQYSITFTMTNPVSGYINICGVQFTIPPTAIVSTTALASWIVANCQSSMPQTVNPGQASAVYDYNLSSTTPGVLTITAISKNLAQPTLFFPPTGGATGISTTLVETDQFQVQQYPYIPNITSDYFINNSILVSTNTQYPLILPTNTVYPYVPFIVALDYSALNPTNVSVSGLGTGYIKIPNYLFGGSSGQNYINFAGGNFTVMNENICIQAIAQVYDSTEITPLAINNIVQILNNSLTPDIKVEITAQ